MKCYRLGQKQPNRGSRMLFCEGQKQYCDNILLRADKHLHCLLVCLFAHFCTFHPWIYFFCSSLFCLITPYDVSQQIVPSKHLTVLLYLCLAHCEAATLSVVYHFSSVAIQGWIKLIQERVHQCNNRIIWRKETLTNVRIWRQNQK